MGSPPTHPDDRTSAVRTLARELARSFDEQFRTLTSAFDLTPTQAAALRELDEPLTQRDLAARLCCEPSNVTFVIDKLEDRSLIHRAAHPTDRRAKLLVLTEAGTRLRDHVLAALQDNEPLRHLTDQELTNLQRVLERAVEPGAHPRNTG